GNNPFKQSVGAHGVTRPTCATRCAQLSHPLAVGTLGKWLPEFTLESTNENQTHSDGGSAGRRFQTEHPGNNFLCLFKFLRGKAPQTALKTLPLDGAKAGEVDHTGFGQPRRLRKRDFTLASANFGRERA